MSDKPQAYADLRVEYIKVQLGRKWDEHTPELLTKADALWATMTQEEKRAAERLYFAGSERAMAAKR